MFNKYFKLNTNLILILFSALHMREIVSYQCYTCKGSNCQKESKLKDTMECDNPWDDCVSVFSEFNILERGCYSTLPLIYRKKCDTHNTTQCHRCFAEKCNDIGPSYCIQCNSNDDFNCFYQPVDIEASYCPISIQINSYCFVRYNTSGYLERGCLLSREEQRDCDKNFSCKPCLPNAGLACNNEFQRMIMGASQVKVYSLLIAVASLMTILLK